MHDISKTFYNTKANIISNSNRKIRSTLFSNDKNFIFISDNGLVKVTIDAKNITLTLYDSNNNYFKKTIVAKLNEMPIINGELIYKLKLFTIFPVYNAAIITAESQNEKIAFAPIVYEKCINNDTYCEGKFVYVDGVANLEDRKNPKKFFESDFLHKNVQLFLVGDRKLITLNNDPINQQSKLLTMTFRVDGNGIRSLNFGYVCVPYRIDGLEFFQNSFEMNIGLSVFKKSNNDVEFYTANYYQGDCRAFPLQLKKLDRLKDVKISKKFIHKPLSSNRIVYVNQNDNQDEYTLCMYENGKGIVNKKIIHSNINNANIDFIKIDLEKILLITRSEREIQLTLVNVQNNELKTINFPNCAFNNIDDLHQTIICHITNALKIDVDDNVHYKRSVNEGTMGCKIQLPEYEKKQNTVDNIIYLTTTTLSTTRSFATTQNHDNVDELKNTHDSTTQNTRKALSTTVSTDNKVLTDVLTTTITINTDRKFLTRNKALITTTLSTTKLVDKTQSHKNIVESVSSSYNAPDKSNTLKTQKDIPKTTKYRKDTSRNHFATLPNEDRNSKKSYDYILDCRFHQNNSVNNNKVTYVSNLLSDTLTVNNNYNVLLQPIYPTDVLHNNHSTNGTIGSVNNVNHNSSSMILISTIVPIIGIAIMICLLCALCNKNIKRYCNRNKKPIKTLSHNFEISINPSTQINVVSENIESYELVSNNMYCHNQIASENEEAGFINCDENDPYGLTVNLGNNDKKKKNNSTCCLL